MGRYFGIGNSTKKQSVSSYWKGDEWCNCYQVMHQMHWDKTDSIYSCCYDTICEFNYDIESGELNAIDVTEQRMNQHYKKNNINYDDENDDDENDDDENDDDENINVETKNVETKNVEIKTIENENVETVENVKTGKYGFDDKLCDDKLNHIPQWDGNRCVKCDYYYDELLLEEYKQKFDGCFFMS